MEKVIHSKTARILVTVGIALVVILLILRISLPSIIKNIVERKLNEKLGANTTIGGVDLSLLRGSVTMRKIRIDNPSGFDSKPFLSMQNIFVNVALTSLLSNEIRIERVDIKHLVLGIHRTKEGHINLKPILAQVKTPPSPSPEKPPSSEKSVEAQSRKGIFLELFKAEDVQISFEDYAISEPPLITEMKDLTLSLKSFRYPDTSAGTESEINITGQLVATKTSPVMIHSTFQLGKTPPVTIVSDSREKYDDIYLPHFNPYVRRYGYIFTSGLLTMTYHGKTDNGLIDGLANLRFNQVQFKQTELRLSSLVLGIPLHAFPQLFQDTSKSLELDLEVSGDIRNPQISWSNLSKQLLIKTLGNAFRAGSIPIRKPFELIFEGVTKGGKEGSIFTKFKDLLNPQTPAEEKKKEVKEDEQKMKLKDFFGKEITDQLNKLKKKGEDKKD